MLKVKILIVLLLVGLVLSAPPRTSGRSDVPEKPVDPPSVECLSASNEDKSVRGAKHILDTISDGVNAMMNSLG